MAGGSFRSAQAGKFDVRDAVTATGSGPAQPKPVKNGGFMGWKYPLMTQPKSPQGTGPAPDPGKGSAYAPGAQPTATPPPTVGTESGPGILEQWFNMRATGSDPAFDYMSKRGLDALDTRMAAGGSFNSGARGQFGNDLIANLISQRMGQLDSLAGGASGEHQGRLNSMFSQGLGLAGGQAGTMGAYDLGAANAMNAANQAILAMGLNKAGVDSQANQGFFNNMLSLGALTKMK